MAKTDGDYVEAPSEPANENSALLDKQPQGSIYAIAWLFVLVFISWPLAGFCIGVWVVLQVRICTLDILFL